MPAKSFFVSVIKMNRFWFKLTRISAQFGFLSPSFSLWVNEVKKVSVIVNDVDRVHTTHYLVEINIYAQWNLSSLKYFHLEHQGQTFDSVASNIEVHFRYKPYSCSSQRNVWLFHIYLKDKLCPDRQKAQVKGKHRVLFNEWVYKWLYLNMLLSCFVLWVYKWIPVNINIEIMKLDLNDLQYVYEYVSL